jgi:DUF1680 family protein
MRLLSSWPQYLATSDDTGIQIHQYTSADIDTSLAGSEAQVAVRTGYPWDGRVTVQIVATPQRPWTLSLRVPGWSRTASLTLPDQAPRAVTAGVVHELRAWRPGDRVVLDLDLPVRVTEPDPQVDAVRGCVAFERGPIVYCIESADLPDTVEVEDLRWDPAREAVTMDRPDLGDGVVGLAIPVTGPDPLVVPAVAYHAWANRGLGGMRVWLPR